MYYCCSSLCSLTGTQRAEWVEECFRVEHDEKQKFAEGEAMLWLSVAFCRQPGVYGSVQNGCCLNRLEEFERGDANCWYGKGGWGVGGSVKGPSVCFLIHSLSVLVVVCTNVCSYDFKHQRLLCRCWYHLRLCFKHNFTYRCTFFFPLNSGSWLSMITLLYWKKTDVSLNV